MPLNTAYPSSFFLQFSDKDGHPFANGSLQTYLASDHSMPVQTYTYPGSGVKNPTIIPLDAAGRCTMALDVDVAYYVVLCDSTGAVQGTWDNVTAGGGFGGGGGSTRVQSDWAETDPNSPAYIKNKPKSYEAYILAKCDNTQLTDPNLNHGLSTIESQGSYLAVENGVLKIKKKGVYHVDVDVRITGATVDPNDYEVVLTGYKQVRLKQIYDNTYEHDEVIHFAYEFCETTLNSRDIPLTITHSIPGAKAYIERIQAFNVHPCVVQVSVYTGGTGININEETMVISADFDEVQKKLTPASDNVSIDDNGNISVTYNAEEVELTQEALTARFETIEGLYNELEEGKQFVFVRDIEDGNRPGKIALYVSERLRTSQLPDSGYYITLCGISWGGYGEPYHGAPREFLVSYCKLENNLNPSFNGFDTKPFFTDWIGSGWGPGVYTEGQITWYTESVSASMYRSVVLYRCILGYTATNDSPMPKNDATHWEEVKLVDLINELFNYSLTQSDWNQNDSSAPDYIKNKPTLYAPTFVATKDVTTFADLKAAIDAGQQVLFKDSSSASSFPLVPDSYYYSYGNNVCCIVVLRYVSLSATIAKETFTINSLNTWSSTYQIVHSNVDEVATIVYGTAPAISLSNYAGDGKTIFLRIGSNPLYTSADPYKWLPLYSRTNDIYSFRDIQPSQDGKKLQAVDYKWNDNTRAWSTETTDLFEIQPGTVVLTTSSTATDIQTALNNGAVPLLKAGNYYFQMTRAYTYSSLYSYTFTRVTQDSSPYVYVISNTLTAGIPNTNGAWQVHDELLMQVDWNQTDATKPDHIKNRPDTLPLVEGTDIQIDEVNSQVVISSTAVPAHTPSESGKVLVVDSNGGLQWQDPQTFTQVQADWNQTDSAAVDYIKNKPSIPVIHTITL